MPYLILDDNLPVEPKPRLLPEQKKAISEKILLRFGDAKLLPITQRGFCRQCVMQEQAEDSIYCASCVAKNLAREIEPSQSTTLQSWLGVAFEDRKETKRYILWVVAIGLIALAAGIYLFPKSKVPNVKERKPTLSRAAHE